MKRGLLALCIMLGLSFSLTIKAQERDEEMINAQLRFIMENADLNRKEYDRFAKIYIEYNEQLANLNRTRKPGEFEYVKEWREINDSYQKKLEKALPDSTRFKIGVAQWQLGQKIWQEWVQQNQRDMDQRLKMWQNWAEANRQMMRSHIFDYHQRNRQEWENAAEQQREWWENYWKNWTPDSNFFRVNPEMRRFHPERFMPQFPMNGGNRRGFMPQFNHPADSVGQK
ncbi:MAG: hypothetical protein BWY95_00089 [Bacteroidetes bacterium ADurb.BinA104]|nr:MAG: hypothetical protein BWY95_00089 [Bacteroidetes bacterium ADurb.BinA104]